MQKRFNEVFRYDAITGRLHWKIKTGRSVKIGNVAGAPRKDGYWRVQVNNKRYLAHRVIWIMHNGKIPDGMQIDHINHDPSNNLLENLRLVTIQENAMNRSIQSNSSSVMGVYWNSQRNKWQAQIKTNGKNKNLGRFINLQDAVSTRKQAEIKYGFHPNHGKEF